MKFETSPVATAAAPSFDRSHSPRIGGIWKRRGEELIQSDAATSFPILMFGDDRWTDYDFTADFLRTGGAADVSLVVRCTGEGDNLRFGVSGKGEWNQSFLEAREDGAERILKWETYPIVSHKWYTARVSVRGGHMTGILRDGDREVVRLEPDDDQHPKGRVGFRTWYSAYKLRNIRVTAPDGKVLWEGLPAVAESEPTTAGEGDDPRRRRPAPEVHGGAWKVEGDELVQSTLNPGAVLLFGDPGWSSYDFKFRAMSTGGTHGFKAKFHARSRGISASSPWGIPRTSSMT